MSYPYPQDRNRDRREKGEQPYADAKAAMSQEEARLQAEAEQFGETHPQETPEERQARLEAEMSDRLDRAGREATEADR
jgi:hypothetical protein